MKRIFFLTLCLSVLLVGCGQDAPEPVLSDIPPEETPMNVVGYRWGDYANISMPLPEGWEWEPTEMSDCDGEPPLYVGFTFWRTDIPDLCFTFECWPQGFGMCGTGVEFIGVDGKHDLTVATEQGEDIVAVTIIFNNVPGSYVVGGAVPKELWEELGANVVQMGDNATVAEGCLTRDEAVDAIRAENNWPGENCAVNGYYDASEGIWHLAITQKLDGGEEITAYAQVNNRGEVLQLSRDDAGNEPLVWN